MGEGELRVTVIELKFDHSAEVCELKQNNVLKSHEISGWKETICEWKQNDVLKTHEISGLKENDVLKTHEISALKQTHEISEWKQRQQEDDSEKAAHEIMRGLQDIDSNLRMEKNSKIRYLEILKMAFKNMRDGRNDLSYLLLDIDESLVVARKKEIFSAILFRIKDLEGEYGQVLTNELELAGAEAAAINATCDILSEAIVASKTSSDLAGELDNSEIRKMNSFFKSTLRVLDLKSVIF